MSTLVEKSEALAVEVSCSNEALSVTLSDGRVVSVPLAWLPRLADATPQERSDWELIGTGNFMRLPNVAHPPTDRARRRHGRAWRQRPERG